MKSLIQIFRLQLKQYPGWMMWGLIIALVASLASVALLATAGWYLGATFTAGLTAGGVGLVFNTVYPGFLIRAAALTRTFGRYGERLVTHDATFRFLSRMRLGVYDGISQLPFRALRDFRSGELLARLTADIDALDGLYLRVVLPLFTAIASTILLLIGLHLLNAPLAAVLGLILLAMLIILPYKAGRIGAALGRRIAFSNEALRLRLIDLLRGQVELIMAGRLTDQVGSVVNAAEKITLLQDKLSLHDLKGRAIISLISGLALVIVLLMGGRAYASGDLSAPLFLLALLSVMALTELFAPIRRGLLDIGRAIYASQRILPLLAEKPNTRRDFSMENSPVSLEINRVDFAYSANAEPILSDFSLTLRSGEAVGIIGASGAGKSTLLGLAAGLLEPQTGRIRLDHDDGRMAQFTPRIGLLTQRTELFRDTLAFNLRIADANATEDMMVDALSKAQLSDLLDRLPDGLSHHLGDEGQGLSGGESRRLAMARLFLFHPDLWLLDEPTEGLDLHAAAKLMGVLREATQGKALLFVTHKKIEADLADRLLVLKEGQAPVYVTRADHDLWSQTMSSLR